MKHSDEFLFFSFDFVNPLMFIRKIYEIKIELNNSQIKREKKTFLNNCLSYLVSFKNE